MVIETKELIKKITKLRDEGFLNFRRCESDIIDFIKNDMQYIVFEKNGTIGKYTSCRLACGKTWNQVSNLEIEYSPTDLDKKYFNDNHLRLTWFNFICWKELGVIFLNKFDYDVIKFHKNKHQGSAQ